MSVFPEQVLQVPGTVVEYHELLKRLRENLQAGPAIRFVVDRKRDHDRKHRHKKPTIYDVDDMDYSYSGQHMPLEFR